MIRCKHCEETFETLKVYTQHMYLHTTASVLKCGFDACEWSGTKFSSFRAHISYCHRSSLGQKKLLVESDTSWQQCTFEKCRLRFACKKDFLSHFYNHFDDEFEAHIFCPFLDCHKSFRRKTSFQVHVHREHRCSSASESFAGSSGDVGSNEAPNKVELGGLDVPCSSATKNEMQYASFSSETVSEVVGPLSDRVVFEDADSMLLAATAKLYLSLQTSHFVAATTVQKIVECVSALHSQSMAAIREKLSENLKAAGVTDENVTDVIQNVFESDFFQKIHNPDTGIMGTTFKRKKYFQQAFGFVAPLCMVLGRNAKGRQSQFHYVPIEHSISQLLADKCILQVLYSPRYHLAGASYADNTGRVFQDFRDCDFMAGNPVFSDDDSLNLLIYHDEFELVNPLGSGNGIHKILAFYYTLENVKPEFRSGCDHMQLLLVARSKDVKYFGIEKILHPLYSELKSLETKRIAVFGKNFRVNLLALVADSLGHHMLAGLPQNFSSGEVCKYCHATIHEIRNGNVNFRSYPCRTAMELHDGCILNKLSSFSTAFQLLPCVAHDLLEGVVASDLQLCLRHLICNKKWCTETCLQAALSKLKLLSPESNEPPIINLQAKKVPGKAVQLWQLIRFLPCILPVQDEEDPVWQMVMDLTDILHILLSPKISLGQVHVLEGLLTDYIDSRLHLFPQIPLKPKHHYLTHYSQFIASFGPPIRYWTLRFESKHCYFKNTSRSSQNFLNITSTLSERHQMHQTNLGTETRFKTDVEVLQSAHANEDESLTYFVRRYYGVVKATAIQRHGIVYREGMIVVLERNDSMTLVVGCIALLLVDNDSHVTLVVQREHAERQPTGLYLLKPELSGYSSVALNHLACYTPLNVYLHQSRRCIFLKHAILDTFV